MAVEIVIFFFSVTNENIYNLEENPRPSCRQFCGLFANPFLRMCCAQIHKVLLANRNHWAKQKRQDHGGKDCPPPVAASETALVDPLSPKKPLRSEEVLGVGVGVR